MSRASEEYTIYAAGLPLNERHEWTRDNLRGAVGLADTVMGDHRATAVQVRGCYGEGDVLYRVQRLRGEPVTTIAVSAVKAIQLRALSPDTPAVAASRSSQGANER